MNNFDTRLNEVAKDMAAKLTARAAPLKQKLPALQARMQKLQARIDMVIRAIDAADLASERLRTFVPCVGGKYQCANCWIEHGRQCGTQQVNDKSHRKGQWQCSLCDWPHHRRHNNCTRVTSNYYGMRSHVTYRDHEIEQLKQYVAEERAKGAVVTTERGVWIE